MARTAPFFTDKARAAAAEGRRNRAIAKAETKNACEVFVIGAQLPGHFSWEIRKFGAVIIKRTADVFVSQDDARRAGSSALAKLDQDAVRPERAVEATLPPRHG